MLEFKIEPDSATNTHRRTSEQLLAIAVGVLPYVAGASLVFVTTDLTWLAITGGFVTLLSTTGAYVLRNEPSERPQHTG